METSTEPASSNGELENRRFKQEINDNDLDSAPIKVKKRKPCLSDQYDLETMKSNLHDKGNQLSTVWNELYNLLGDYQAKLFNREGEFLASKAKYEGVTDMDQLRNDLISKDNEVKELRERMKLMESRGETIQLDLSVKNSLLKKYQQDLLDKEAALLNLQSSNKKLENRIQALEMKLAGASVPTIQQQQSPQPSTSGISRQSTPPQLKRRGLPHHHSVNKRRPLAPAGQTKAVVCVEVEDSDEARDVNQSVNDSVNLPLYSEQWTEHKEQEDENSNQNVFPGDESEDSGPQWPSQEPGGEQDASLMSQIDSPASKKTQSRTASPQSDPCTDRSGPVRPPSDVTARISAHSELERTPNDLVNADLETLARIASLDPEALRAANLDPNTLRHANLDADYSLEHSLMDPETMITTRNPYGLTSGNRRYQCKQCDVSFANSLDLYEHTRQIHGSALYHCEYPGCTKAYTRSYALTQHMQAHSGKMFQCQACHKTFPMRRGYYQHVTQFCKLAKLMKMNGTWKEYIKQ